MWHPEAIIKDIKSLVDERPFILVEQGMFTGYEGLKGMKIVPFTEKNGVFNGLPADDTSAIAEIERQQKNGACFIIFFSATFWILDYYKGLSDYLRSQYTFIVNNEHLIGFDLRSN